MHIERLTKLAEWLEAGAPHETITFDMTTSMRFRKFDANDPHYTATCGTVCCLAGAAVQFFHEDFDFFVERGIRNSYICADADEDEYSWTQIRDAALRLLDLPRLTADALFVPAQGTPLEQYSDPAWVARTLRHLIATGDVDWERNRP